MKLKKFCVVIQIWRDGDWTPLLQYRPKTYREAVRDAKRHVIWADRCGLDPRRIAAVSFDSGEFLEVPW